MLRFRHCCKAICLALLLTCPASADYVVSIGTPGGTNANLGLAGANRSVDFYLGEDVGGSTAQPLAGLVATFSLEAGQVSGTQVLSGTETASNETGTVSAVGAIGTAGYLGAGNLDTSTISKESANSFLVNQFFTNIAQPVEDFATPSRWFTVNLDTTGLAAGEYAITLSDPNNSFRNSFNQPVVTRSNLSFTVTAVPEPSSVAALAILGCGGLMFRRTRSRKSQQPSV
ncbi:MAG: PEP-CTERM sorting domain-containing protein [Rubripirellula sp.]